MMTDREIRMMVVQVFLNQGTILEVLSLYLGGENDRESLLKQVQSRVIATDLLLEDFDRGVLGENELQ